MTKEETKRSQSQPESTLSIVSLVLGVVSLTGPGILLGVPAIITGAIALKKKQGGRGLSIAGIVTGAISSIFTLLAIMFLVLLIVVGLASSPDGGEWLGPPPAEQHHQQSSQT